MRLGFDEVDEDDQYLDDARLDKPVKKAYEVDFKVFSDDELRVRQREQFEELSNILGLPIEQCATLLRSYKWQKEKLVEQYMDKPEEVTKAAGVLSGTHNPPRIEKKPGFICDICCDDGPDMKTFAMDCGHRFCADCYGTYLTQKITEEGESVRIQCMAEECTVTVNGKAVQLLVTPEVFKRYEYLLSRLALC